MNKNVGSSGCLSNHLSSWAVQEMVAATNQSLERERTQFLMTLACQRSKTKLTPFMSQLVCINEHNQADRLAEVSPLMYSLNK